MIYYIGLGEVNNGFGIRRSSIYLHGVGLEKVSYLALERHVAQVSVKDSAAPAHNTAQSSCHSQL